MTNSASGDRGTTGQTLSVGVGYNMTNSVCGGRVEHDKLC